MQLTSNTCYCCLTASPAGSVQDVSPPSTPSSRASAIETFSHTASPQLMNVVVSPHLAQLPTTPHSPQLQFSQQQSPYVARHAIQAQNMYSHTSVNAPPGLPAQHHFTTQQQYSFPQQAQAQFSNYGQYSHMNASGPPALQQAISCVTTPVSVTPTPQQSLQVFDVPSQPQLHPLQQATLLQQRQLSGVCIGFSNVLSLEYVL